MRSIKFSMRVFLAVLMVPVRAVLAETDTPPNIVLILADDLGYSDLGAFGGEITTPNIDALAEQGLRLSDFNVAPTCSPTRSMLLTGTGNHEAGVGAMAETLSPAAGERYGYEGRLTQRVATVAERLHGAGYTSIMAGKWHLGLNADNTPAARGFDKSFALLQGGHNHFGKGGFGPDSLPQFAATYLNDGKVVDVPADFYSSDYFTARLLEKIDTVNKDQPFFAYLSFTAPHSPLQAPRDLIDKYRGYYDGGWPALREQRLARMKALGIIAADIIPHDMVPDAKAWDRLSAGEKQRESRKMEIYAAMVERLDWNVGRLVEHLKSIGRWDSTVVFFMSDNGPAGETEDIYTMLPTLQHYIRQFDNSLANMGNADSFVFYGPYWAQAGSAPYRLFKGTVAEGGIKSPAFVSASALTLRRGISPVYANVMDIVPTILQLAGQPAANRVEGREVSVIRGLSMLPFLTGQQQRVHGGDSAFAFELHGQRLVRQGPWKLTYMRAPYSNGKWQLFNLTEDPGEREDVASQYPERVKRMVAAWNAFAEQDQVIH